MAVDHIRSDLHLLTQHALRGVIRTVLTDVAVKGLQGEHHFFITFDTRVDGVRLSARLKASYPDEMTIVLQHQFWDLTVGEDDFDVGLAFNGVPERLHIPFKAVKAFVDPSVQFGLQFAVEAEPARGTSGNAGAETRGGAMKPVPAGKPLSAKLAPAVTPPKPEPNKPEPKKPQLKKEPAPQTTVPPAPPSLPASGKADSTGEVVRLDRFRKK